MTAIRYSKLPVGVNCNVVSTCKNKNRILNIDSFFYNRKTIRSYWNQERAGNGKEENVTKTQQIHYSAKNSSANIKQSSNTNN